MKTYLKTLERAFKRHLMRFLSIIFIVVVSVGLISGIGLATEKILSSMNEFYIAQNVSDFIVKSKKDGGFSEDDVAVLKSRYGEDCVATGNSLDFDMEIEGEVRRLRLYFLDFSDWTINTPVHVSGKQTLDLVENDGGMYEVLCVKSMKGLRSFELNTTLSLDFKKILEQSAERSGKETDGMTSMLLNGLKPVEIVVSEIVHSPLAFTVDGEPSYYQEDGVEIPETVNALEELNTLDYILYLPKEAVPKLFGNPVLPERGDVYVTLSDRVLFNDFSAKYKTRVEAEERYIRETVEDVEVITLYDNYSFSSLNAYGDKVVALAIVLLVAFVLVTALVVSSNMSRLMEEERAQIACLRTLGYSGGKIVFKYLLFALVATGIAGVVSYFLGIGLAALIYLVFNYSYVMPPMSSAITLTFYLITYFAIVGATVFVTAVTGGRLVREKPAELLRPRPPKAGKKVFLERIPFLWNRLSFKYKSTMRNVLRYKNRFWMTVVSVACSMGLVLAGLAIFDLCLFHDFGSGAIMGLAFVIVVFAGLLTMAVVYTLTNINISERNREIATLMVLGYYDGEVSGYIYREVYINTLIGIIFGYPVGALLIWVVFKVMNFGVLGELSWFMWLIAPAVVLLFTAFVTLILRRKIVKIDMNESLKANE